MASSKKDSWDESDLEKPDTVVDARVSSESASEKTPEFQLPRPRGSLLKWLLIGGAAVVLLGTGGFTARIMHKSTKPTTTITINTQSLDNGTLNKLTTQTAQGQTVAPQLTISPTTLFKADVSVQDDLTVKGTSSLIGAVAIGDNLAVGGGLTVGRNTGIAGNLSVSGTITAGNLNVGVINLSTLTLSGNISWGGHLVSTGAVVTVSPGVAIGNGTTTVTGNDSVGTVIINAGHSGLLANGEIAIVHFRSAYSGSPIVQLTPADQDAADLPYYVVAAPGFFSIRTTTAPTAGTSYVFNYFVAQ